MTRVPRQDGEKSIWYIRMKQGTGGVDYTADLWRKGLVGVLFGGWRLADILPDHTDPTAPVRMIDPVKLTPLHLEARWRANQSTTTSPGETVLSKADVKAARKFLAGDAGDVQPGDRVICSYSEEGSVWLACGTLTDQFHDHPVDIGRCLHKKWGEEFFKCRGVTNQRGFALSNLPSAYRLLRGTGQGTLQKMQAYYHLASLLFECSDEESVRAHLATRDAEELLGYLSDKHWEVICAEWMREERHTGMKLLLGVGGTLESLDIVAVSDKGALLVGQCKNSHGMGQGEIDSLAEDLSPSKVGEAVRYLFIRGVTGDVKPPAGIELVTAETIVPWLRKDRSYVHALATR